MATRRPVQAFEPRLMLAGDRRLRDVAPFHFDVFRASASDPDDREIFYGAMSTRAADGLRDEIETFIHNELVPSGNRVLVTSRPEGVQLSTYSKTFIVMNLCQLTNEQQRRVINIQMQGNIFFDHLLSLGEVRKMLDDAYRKVSPNARADLETMWREYPHDAVIRRVCYVNERFIHCNGDWVVQISDLQTAA